MFLDWKILLCYKYMQYKFGKCLADRIGSSLYWTFAVPQKYDSTENTTWILVLGKIT